VGGVSDMASSSFLSRWGCCAVLKAPVGFDPPTAHCGVRPPRDNRIRVRWHHSCFSWRTRPQRCSRQRAAAGVALAAEPTHQLGML
jgi:hypothetical protein